MATELTVDGRPVVVEDEQLSLLTVLREQVGVKSVKDGCSPQGQCGCCTVLVNGSPRVACVTAARRVAGASITTVEGLDPARRDPLVARFLAHGASQCGFCTPGIIVRLAALGPAPSAAKVEQALLAHLCRCTGWRSIVDAAADTGCLGGAGPRCSDRDLSAAAVRACLEGAADQNVGSEVVVGNGGFADDTAPPEALVAVPDGLGGWALGENIAEARQRAGKVQGRRSGRPLSWPLEIPPAPEGGWALSLRTTWVEPAYLETDAAWARPGEPAVSALANGGAFGAKRDSVVTAAAERLANEHGRPVRVLLSREDTVRLGPKRPPVAAGVAADGTGVLRAMATPGIARAVALAAPALEVEEVTGPLGPPTSVALRGAGWAEAAVLLAGLEAWRGGLVAGRGQARVVQPGGGVAEAQVRLGADDWPEAVTVTVEAGDVLDEVVLRSYVAGAAHMGLGWVLTEGIAVGDDGVPDDLTIRSFGVLRARDTPPITVIMGPEEGPPVAVSDAAMAATAAATWIALGLPTDWPARPERRGR